MVKFITGIGEEVGDNEDKTSKNTQGYRRLKITQLIQYVVENAKSENELMIIMGHFMKTYKKEIDELNEILDYIYNKVKDFQEK